MIGTTLDRYVIGREQNVVRVNFAREPEPPIPPFPGAGGMRAGAQLPAPVNAFSTSIKREVA